MISEVSVKNTFSERGAIWQHCVVAKDIALSLNKEDTSACAGALVYSTAF